MHVIDTLEQLIVEQFKSRVESLDRVLAKMKAGVSRTLADTIISLTLPNIL